MKEEILFNLVETDWDASAKQEGRNWYLSLRHASHPGQTMTLYIDVDRRAATIDTDSRLLSLGWIERHLRNFALYESWDAMHDALPRSVKRKQPDVVIPLAEVWANSGPACLYITAVSQPHILDPNGTDDLWLRSGLPRFAA
jgi:hypothetical protein